jgi:hypothetical protein
MFLLVYKHVLSKKQSIGSPVLSVENFEKGNYKDLFTNTVVLM